MSENPNICIGMACSDYIRTGTTLTLVSLFKSNPTMGFIVKQSPYVHKNREAVVVDALNSKNNYTHLFFVDSDMSFKPEVLTKLLAADKDIVGGLYFKRGTDKEPVFTIRYDEIPTKLFKQPILATGCLLIKLDVFRKIPQPWFDLGTLARPLGEDVYFCEKARENGYELWCEPSLPVGHIGDKIY